MFFPIGELKNSVETKKLCCVGLYSKVVSAVGFSENLLFWKVPLFTMKCLMWPVHVVIFLKKYLVKLFRISFFCFAKDTHNDNFENVGKMIKCK